MKAWAYAALGVLLLLGQPTATVSASAPTRMWIFCDLGNTLIDTDNPDQLHYLKGARAYLETIHRAGHSMGLIVNLPDSWGRTREEKVAYLKRFVNLHWDPQEEPFPWDWFGAVLVPPDQSHRKPDPFLFQEALGIASHDQTGAVYQGEDAVEVDAARRLGFIGHVIGAKDQPSYWLGDLGFQPPAPAKDAQKAESAN